MAKDKPSLLDRALSLAPKRPPRKVFSADEIELALAWAAGEVTITQVANVLNTHVQNAYCFLANCLRQVINSK